MKVGELYRVKSIWALPRGNDPKSGHMFWSKCGPVLYLGEDVIEREDGARIVNHVVLVDGERRVVDYSFLRFFEHIDAPVSNSMRF